MRGESLENALLGGLIGVGVGRLFDGGKRLDDVNVPGGGGFGKSAAKSADDGDWVDQLIRDRRIAKPDGVEFDSSALAQVQRLFSGKLFV